MIRLDMVQTLAMGGISLFLGYLVCRKIPFMHRHNIPPPVVGGLLVALLVWAAQARGVTLFEFDTRMQSPLMIAFFTAIGFNASVALLRVSGRQVIVFLGLASLFAVVQNLVGMAVAASFGLNPLFGVLAGSTTLTGGPATGLAFAPLFEARGVAGAETVAVAAAMAGIVCGGLIGGPVATVLIRKYRLKSPMGEAAPTGPLPDLTVLPPDAAAQDQNAREYASLKALVLILLAMWAGSWISRGFEALGLILPPYVGAMMIGAAIRNLDDRTGWLGLSLPSVEVIGNICLTLFLAVALMNLKLWELAGLALPLLVNLVVQVLLVALFCLWVVYRVMGRDYDAAVMGGGFIGFMLGTTANAMAVMRTLVERYGMAPRAFLVAPLVGAFFIDFTNALVITGFLNWAG